MFFFILTTKNRLTRKDNRRGEKNDISMISFYDTILLGNKIQFDQMEFSEPGVVAQACILTNWEAKEGRW